MKKIYHTQFLASSNNFCSIFIGMIFSLLFSSCDISNKPDSKVLDIVSENGKKIKNDFNGYFLIIPNEGCHPCIEYAWKFTKKNLSNNHIYFIITTDFDFKRTKVKFSKSDLISNNFVLDLQHKSVELGFPNNQLFLLYIKDGLIVSKENISPENIKSNLLNLQRKIDIRDTKSN